MSVDAKKKLREKIWDELKENQLTNPQRTYGRIPRFKGAMKAASRLRKTIEWDDSGVIFCSPDSAQREIREYALLDGKKLIMASPKLKMGYLEINPHDVINRTKTVSTIKGAYKYGKPLKKFPPVDLVVEGSVAVDLSGRRLGKGGGYADQEIKHLLNENSISTKTTIATTVHENQIVDEIPTEPHDMKINMIVTPQRVIRIEFNDKTFNLAKKSIHNK
jgi:5-formyltetrahydrofolate cyclo-ligase